MQFRKTLIALLLLAFALLQTGCVSQQSGENGLLKFSYVADDVVNDFNKAIAIGARLDVSVSDAAALLLTSPATVTAATSSDAKILKIVEFSGSKVTIEAMGAGNADITVVATLTNGKSVTDVVNMRGAAATGLTMTPGCGGAGTALYLTGRRIAVAYDLTAANGTPVIGYGLHPVTVSPAAGLAWDATSTDQWAFWYQTSATPGEVTLTSTLGTKSWNVKLVPEAAIDGAKLDISSGTLVKAGSSALVYARPTVGGQPVCQAATAFTVAGKTPDICAVSAMGQAPTAKVVDGWSLVNVTGKQVGKCEFDVTWVAGNGGKGVTQTLSVDVGAVVKP